MSLSVQDSSIGKRQDGSPAIKTTFQLFAFKVRDEAALLLLFSKCLYASPTDNLKGYRDFMLQNPRYAPMRQAQGLEAQLQALGASGYAADPNYANSVVAIARGIQLPADAAPTQIASLDPSAGMGSIPSAAVAPGQPPRGMSIPVPTQRADPTAQTAFDPATGSPSEMRDALGFQQPPIGGLANAAAAAQQATAPQPAVAPPQTMAAPAALPQQALPSQQQVAQALVNRPSGRQRVGSANSKPAGNY